jgi:hypothetical protein
MSWIVKMNFLQNFVARSIDRSIKLTTKNHWFWGVISYFQSALSGFQLSPSYFREFTCIVIGPIQAYPFRWTVKQVEAVLQHECQHTIQFRRFGLNISPWLGILPMLLVYTCLLFPIFFAYGRFRLELDAEIANWKQILSSENFGSEDVVRQEAVDFIYKISCPEYCYAWMWPKGRVMYEAEKLIDKYTTTI